MQATDRIRQYSCLLLIVLCGAIANAQEPGAAADHPDLSRHFPAINGFESEVPIYRVATGRIIHRFFDTSPLSPSGRYLALFRMPNESSSPQPGEEGEVVLIDLEEGTEKTIATTRGWEVQLGANVQWGKSDAKLYYNDVDTETWTPFTVEHQIFTGERRNLEGSLFTVSPDGSQIASYNLASSRLIQKGYGVVLPEEKTVRNAGPVKDDGIFITDVATGKRRLVASLEAIAPGPNPRSASKTLKSARSTAFRFAGIPTARVSSPSSAG